MQQCPLNNIHISYETFGSGRIFIGLHGRSVDHQIMTNCLEPIFNTHQGWQRIYPDLPGMGETKGLDWAASSDNILEILLEFIDKVAPRQNIVLAGESYGGYLAQGIVQRKINSIDGLLLICPAIIPDFNQRTLPPKTVLTQDQNFLAKLSPSELAYLQLCTIIQTEEVWEKFKTAVISGYEKVDNNFIEKLKKNYNLSMDFINASQVFTKPTLLLTGRQDCIVGYKDHWSIMDKYPHMTFAVLDRAGHNLEIEQTGLFQSLVNEWLDRVSIKNSNNKNLYRS